MELKNNLHPRNKHRSSYDFEKLTKASPELGKFVALNKFQVQSINFADPKAVLALNRALLRYYYGLEFWDIPPNFLCPPIPGRADYIHYLADLIGQDKKQCKILDVGVGANCVYPLIGHKEYGWNFVGSDIDAKSIESAKRNVEKNNLQASIELRLQSSSSSIFNGVVRKDEFFKATICNPPFHGSEEQAIEGTQRKWKNLGKGSGLNFGGQKNELWCDGGELGFIHRMIVEGQQYSRNIEWFTSLVSREEHLHAIQRLLQKAKVRQCMIQEMSQGQKKTRFIAWQY